MASHPNPDPLRRLAPPAFLVLLLAAPGRAADALPDKVEFNRDVRPILSDNCFQCHGPDKGQRKAKLRLDTEDGANVVKPGHPAQSELFRRITSDEASEKMPPAKTGKKLTPRDLAVLKRWIEQGAKWEKHWSLLPPRRHPPPRVENADWVRNPIDHFILARLERDGLSPSPEADRTTLLRRVSLDLTGLPPTPAEVDAFLADQSPDAYEKAVERLLASPRYGERMAILWLDAARYADTNGYQSDGERFMWRWRDWVLDAFNRNLPFDQFTVEQVAGDLLPSPTLDQRIATGFNRNHRGNAEGGIIPEEYAVEYVVDRVDTTTTVWLGLSFACARCHDHKYDPFTQKDYYSFFAFFNNVPERGKAIKYGNSPPVLKAPTRHQQQQWQQSERRVQQAHKQLADLEGDLGNALREWEKSLPASPEVQWFPDEGLIAHYPLDAETKSAGVKDGKAEFEPGKLGRALALDGKRHLDAGDIGDLGFYDKFSFSTWIYPKDASGGAILSRTQDTARAEGYVLQLTGGKLQLNLVKRWLDDALRVETARALEPGRWHHVAAVYDGSRVADGVKLYIDGKAEPLKVLLDDLNQSFQTKAPFRIGAGGGPTERFEGRIDEVRAYDRPLKPDEVLHLATAESISSIAATPEAKRTAAQSSKVRAYYLQHHAPARFREAYRRVVEATREHERFVESIPTTMVMQELPTPRDTHVLVRGQYDRPGEKVAPATPAVLPSLPDGAKTDRLALARWLVDPANPLTARVTVNRMWQAHFGTGLVKTTEDFGLQGEWPSHPELLDWLATEFIRTGWDVKAMHRLIVTSATYRQSSKVTRPLFQRDPDNRLLARGPRLRLGAETVRDQALFVSGLLAERLGGPSVKPYQPKGLWEELSGTAYNEDNGEALYRRSLYIFWKRTIPPPGMSTFDAPAREACVVHRSRTNTPLQALALMNDVTFVEASRVLAQRAIKEAEPFADSRLTHVFRLATSREPRPAELAILKAALDRHLAHYRDDRDAAKKLLAVGSSPRDQKLDAGELAAYTTVVGTILNLDEVVTRE